MWERKDKVKEEPHTLDNNVKRIFILENPSRKSKVGEVLQKFPG